MLLPICRAAQLSLEEVDMAMFIFTDALPTLKLCETECKTRGQLKTRLQEEATRLQASPGLGGLVWKCQAFSMF